MEEVNFDKEILVWTKKKSYNAKNEITFLI